MASVTLEGETLGQKHRSYNKVLKELTIESKDPPVELSQINYDEPDIDNLLKIDIASYNKNVEYIIEVLKCEDMLYVSRALKQSVWLITNIEYKHIINPDYIYSNLLPQMTSKAGQKFLLTIRLNLADEKRVEEFYEYYYSNKQQNLAFKWLPKCSSSFVETVVDKHGKDIPITIMQRLCEKSFSIFEVCIQKMDTYELRRLMSKSLFLLHKEPVKFLNIVKKFTVHEPYCRPKFNSKITNFIMKSCPETILSDFETFAKIIDIPTFTKFLKKEDIKNFIIEHMQNKKLRSWFTFEIMKHFITRMPIEGRFEFIKQVCIDTHQEQDPEPFSYEYASDECNDDYILCCAMKTTSRPSNANIYKWYRFASFSTAFIDLQKLMRTESNPSERNEMFAVLMSCARRNLQNVQTLLQYYRDKHINEPFKFKSHFVNIVLSHSDTHRFDEKTWSILNEIFCSMEVYDENDNNNVQSCITHIILYNVIHNLNVPDIVENKFEFDTLKSFQKKLNEEEKEKVFNYLYQYMITTINKLQLDNETDLMKAKKHILNILKLLVDWKKDLLDHIVILDKIRELVLAKTEICWNEDLSDIYNIKKSWRKHMFKESLFMHLAKQTFVNALKHDPKILTTPNKDMILNNKMVPDQLLNKLRIYWPQSLAKIFKDHFRNQLSNTTYHDNSIQGLCILLPQQELMDIIKTYKPLETKINWGETDALTLSIQKYLAKYMHIARPQPSVDLVLMYAKGDYLQFSLPSIHSILYNISKNRSLEYIPTLLDAPVSLQKHGLRFASAKLKTDEILNTCLTSWKSTKNSSIRAAIFRLVFDLLCRKENETKVAEIWNVLSILIDGLTSEENKNIYATLSEASKVPLTVRQDFCIKSYRFLKSLPPKMNCESYVTYAVAGIMDILEFVVADFVSEVVFDSFDKKFGSNYYPHINLIASYLLSTKSEIEQSQRYERIFVPLLLKYLTFVNDTEKEQKWLKSHFQTILKLLHKNVHEYVFEKDMILVIPTKLFNDIYDILEKNFPNEEYYVMLLTWKISAEYMKIIEKHRSQKKECLKYAEYKSMSNFLFLEARQDFGEMCLQLLNNEIKQYFPGIYRLFSHALKRFFERFAFTYFTQIMALQSMQELADIDEGHLLVLKVIPKYYNNKKDKHVRAKLYEILRSHPSIEVRMQCQQTLRRNEECEG